MSLSRIAATSILLLILLFLPGCGGEGQKEINKDKDRPKAAEKPAEKK